MTLSENVSEVARLKQRIELECQAMNLGLNGYAEVARHQIITTRYRAIGKYQEELQILVGEEEAMQIMCETYNNVVEQK